MILNPTGQIGLVPTTLLNTFPLTQIIVLAFKEGFLRTTFGIEVGDVERVGVPVSLIGVDVVEGIGVGKTKSP